MANWEQLASISALLSQEDITIASGDEFDGYASPMLKLVAEAHSKGFDYTCLPLTTPHWRDRWTEMCVLPSGKERDKARDIAAEKRAEAWRSNPGFLKDEVNITRLGDFLARHFFVLVFDFVPFHRRG
jgi:protein arginine N-methyltransferase 5